MDNNNAAENWAPMQQSQPNTATVESPWVKVSQEDGKTPYESFASGEVQNTPKMDVGTDVPQEGQDVANKGALNPNKGQPKEVSPGVTGIERKTPEGKTYFTDLKAQRPPENWLNATYHLASGNVWSTFVKPFVKPQPDMDQYLADLDKKHPIGSIVGGTAPFLVTMPFLPESLLPNVYARTAAQFGGIGLMQGIQTAREDHDKSLPSKIGDIAGETVKQAAFSPIYAKAQVFKILDRPFASALARAGIITSGSGVMSAVFGDNLSQAVKQGGMYGGLSLISELPHLSGTMIGRGLIAHTNSVYQDMAVKAGWPLNIKIDVDANYKPEPTEEMALKKYHVREISDLLAVSEGPQTIPDGEGGYKRLSSGWPSFLSDKGYNREQLNTIFNKFLNDQELTESQQGMLNQVLKDAEPFTKGLTPLQKQIETVTTAIASQVPDINKPNIISATVKLPDGTEIHGSSHEDALEKLGETKSETITEEAYLSSKGASFMKGSEPALHRTPGGFPKGQREKYLEKVQEEMKKNNERREELRKEYADKVSKGEIKLPSRLERLISTASGDENLESVQAARRLLDKQGIDWRNPPTKGLVEGVDFTAGFTVQNPDGTTKFITREESKKEPFNLPRGWSEDVQGLNESKWLDHKEPEIVNPETLSMIANNEGKMDVGMLPGVPETAEILSKSHEELKEKFAPYAMGEEGKYTAATLRENLGLMARSFDRLESSLDNARRMFDKADKETSLEFIYNMEEGKGQKTQDLQKIADVLRNMLDTKRDEIRALGTGKLDNFIENYFPHVWENPNKVGQIIKRIMGRRPFAGPASFLKKRTIPTTREGIDLGFTPVSYNPIDSVMLKVREMDRYLMAHRTIQALKEEGLIKFVRTGSAVPENFVKIDDRFADVFYKNEAGELVMAGKYYAQKDAGRILNNYLSPGLRGKSYLYDMYRGAGNTLNQFQLGISAFHLGFTSMDATVSKFALGINKLSMGDYAGALQEFARAPFAPVTNILQGRKLLQSWYGKDNGHLTNMLADVMASAGGRAKMDKFYSTGWNESFKKSLKEGKIVTAALKVPFYVVEQMARPIMEYIVPRQKMGVFFDMMKMEIERNPDISHEQLRGIAQRAWDSVDNRMGQLVYDNLFWNRITKDMAMASVRSVGWNLGTIRELGGGFKDISGNVKDFSQGKATRLSYRTAYLIALPMVAGLYGAIYQFLHTGKYPGQDHEDEGWSGIAKDLYFPRNGAIDNKGNEARNDLPTYMKDIYHYTTNPVQTVINKFSPVNNTVLEMLSNKDFYGTEIRNMDDPAMKQILDELKFVGGQFEPFGFRNLGRDTRTSAGSRIEPFIGITPAPYDINMTKAEREAYKMQQEGGKFTRTQGQAEHDKTKYDLRNRYMASKDPSEINDAVSKGDISGRERREIIKEAAMTPLQRMTRNMTYEQVNHLLKFANDKEQAQLEEILTKKRQNKEKRGTWTKEEEALYNESFASQ